MVDTRYTSRKCKMHTCCHGRAPATPRCLHVAGLESSGTRFVTRQVAQLWVGHHNWNGMKPPCIHARAGTLFHLSLPWGGDCVYMPRTSVVNWSDHVHPVCQNYNAERNARRFVLNLTSAIAHDCRVIHVLREDPLASVSRFYQHCPDARRLQWEERTARRVVRDAQARFPDRVLEVNYDELHMPATWVKIATFAWSSCENDACHVAAGKFRRTSKTNATLLRFARQRWRGRVSLV